MTNIISTISGHFSKTLILGTFLPAAVFVIFGLIFVEPMFPHISTHVHPFEAINTQWIIIISFLTILLSGLLYNLNIPLIRFYEGYPWTDSWFGQLLTRHYKSRFVAAHARWIGLRTLMYALESFDKDATFKSPEKLAAIIEEWWKSGTSINTEYPTEESNVLPTRLGNVIRSFESYPDRQYGISAITLWPRLLAKVDKDYAAALNDAKTSFDFMLNSSFLSAALSLMILIVGLLYPIPFASLYLGLVWFIKIISFASLARVLYLLSIGQASSWGTLVKGAFDLYRWELLKQLGFKKLPENLKEERELWNDISDQMIFGDSPRVRQAEYIPELTYARGEPYVIELEITRGGSPLNKEGKIKITLAVRNADAENRSVKDVVITDTLPEGYCYEWNSLRSETPNISMTGTNPYKFYIGNLDYNAQVILNYCAVPCIAPN